MWSTPPTSPLRILHRAHAVLTRKPLEHHCPRVLVATRALRCPCMPPPPASACAITSHFLLRPPATCFLASIAANPELPCSSVIFCSEVPSSFVPCVYDVCAHMAYS